MEETTLKIRALAREALSSGSVDLVLGFEKGDFFNESCPVFIQSLDDVDRLIWDEYCVHLLSKYLIEELQRVDKIAVFLKGCDSKAFNQLVKDKRLDESRIVIYGIPCQGMVDIRKEDQGLYDKCLGCENPNPVLYHERIGEEVDISNSGQDKFEKVIAIEAMTADEKYNYWTDQFSKCVRCYACRNVCPACSCVKCIFENPEAGVSGKAKLESEDQFFHLTRAYHVAGRCVDCGECSRVCPEGIPLDQLNRKIIKDIEELYGSYDAGLQNTGKGALVTYELNDLDPFEKPKGGKS